MEHETQRAVRELVEILQRKPSLKLKTAAIETISGLTGDAAGLQIILSDDNIPKEILHLLSDEDAHVYEEAYKAMINISANDCGAQSLFEHMTTFIDIITDPKSLVADEACKILNNLTQTEKGSQQFLIACRKRKNDEKTSELDDLIDKFCKLDFNVHGVSLDHIASVLANMTQIEEGRKLLLNHNSPVIGRILPFLNPDSPVTRRRGTSMVIKNCCFEHEHHQWLLDQDCELLSRLLLPLAGAEELDDDENDALPLDLQYLPDDKQREPDPEIRRTLLETLLLLCADKYGRQFLKNSGTYYIIRELHMWELEHGSNENGDECEKLVQILIADEPEAGMENLMEVPDEKLEKFQQ